MFCRSDTLYGVTSLLFAADLESGWRNIFSLLVPPLIFLFLFFRDSSFPCPDQMRLDTKREKRKEEVYSYFVRPQIIRKNCLTVTIKG